MYKAWQLNLSMFVILLAWNPYLGFVALDVQVLTPVHSSPMLQLYLPSAWCWPHHPLLSLNLHEPTHICNTCSSKSDTGNFLVQLRNHLLTNLHCGFGNHDEKFGLCKCVSWHSVWIMAVRIITKCLDCNIEDHDIESSGCSGGNHETEKLGCGDGVMTPKGAFWDRKVSEWEMIGVLTFLVIILHWRQLSHICSIGLKSRPSSEETLSKFPSSELHN